jgi:hypothetical protein
MKSNISYITQVITIHKKSTWIKHTHVLAQRDKSQLLSYGHSSEKHRGGTHWSASPSTQKEKALSYLKWSLKDK